MGIQIIPQGGLAISVLPTGLTRPISSQTLVSIQLVGRSTTNAVYTVTAGKTFYCTGITYVNSGGTSQTINLYDGANSHAQVWLNQNSSAQVIGAPIIFKAAAGTNITVVHGFAGGYAGIYLTGWEQ